ncbi:polysaccharide biosynthesis/export family protein [Microvirga lenta]|uniref:polysaccharide biosynthesis/export family protein n=1 Tax=Microvirga lenta TaxID=2881337 RepID=UPI001CFFF1A1|nr:polysaccharide biosynthesis/export family protein [Microvirga lenta]MCB5176481.1 polysaccharide biosynthesis/export family protein [Microvirga lenta]
MSPVVQSLRLPTLLLIGALAFGSTVLHVRPVLAESDASPQQLSTGDRVQITVFQQPELSGDFVVDRSGAVILPLVGAIPVQDLTLVEAEKRIAARLADGYMDRAVVSLKINEQRPIHILGDVRSPGSYPYRYGASVLSAVALAGGIGAAEQAAAGNRSELLQADERLQVLQATHRALYVRRARLEAQRAGSPKVVLPEGAPYASDDPDVARILKEEQDILSVQRVGHEQTLRLLRDQKPRLTAEIAGVKAQSDAEEKQLQLLQEHIADYNKLVSTGLARRYAMIELQREEARHKGNLARFAADIARLEISIGEIGVRIQEAENEYMRRTITELQEARARMQEMEITIPLAQEVRAARLTQSRTALMGAAGDATYTVAILRSRSGKEELIQGDMRTRLAPGDIIEVRQQGSGGPAPASLIGSLVVQAQNAATKPVEEVPVGETQ